MRRYASSTLDTRGMLQATRTVNAERPCRAAACLRFSHTAQRLRGVSSLASHPTGSARRVFACHTPRTPHSGVSSLLTRRRALHFPHAAAASRRRHEEIIVSSRKLVAGGSHQNVHRSPAWPCFGIASLMRELNFNEPHNTRLNEPHTTSNTSSTR